MAGLPQAGVELVAEGLSQFLSGMGKADDAVQKFGSSGGAAGKSFSSGFGEVVTGALRQVGAIAVDALAQAGKAVGGFLKDSVKVAGDFQAGMLEFQAVAGKGVDTKGLEQFHDLFIQLGKELPVSTSDVQKAAIEMVKGGIDPAIIAAGGLRQNIQFAAAAMNGDLVQAATISSKLLGGWGNASMSAADQAAFLTHSTDLLTKAANASSVDVHELSLGIFNAQGIAKTAGVSFDDLTTTLAEIAPRFASSSEAGNSLKNVIARLQPTTDAAANAMTSLGLITADGSNKFYDATGKFVGFQQASQLLQDSLKGLTQQQQQQVLQTIFGNDAMNAAASLAELGAAGYQKMADSLVNANGVAENAALKQQGFNTALENAKGSVEALQITVGEKLLPILTDLLNNTIAPAINSFTEWSAAILSAKDPFAALVDSVKKFSPVLADIIKSIPDVVDALGDILKTAGDVAGSIGDLVKSFQSGGGASKDLGKVMGDLSGIFQQFQKTAMDVLSGYQAIVQAVLPVIQQFWQQHGTEIMGFLKTTYDQIITIIRTALQLYDSIVPPILQAIAGFISAHGDEIVKVLSGAWQVISSIVTGALETLKGVIQLGLDVIHGDWQKAWEDIQHILDAQVSAIEGVVTGFLNMIAGLFNTNLGQIRDTWQSNWDQLVDIAMKIGDRLVAAGRAMIEGILSGMRSMAGAIGDYLIQIGTDAINAFLDRIGARSPAKEFMPAGEFMIQGILSGMDSTLPSLLGFVDQMGATLIASINKITEQQADAIRKQVDDAKKQIQNAQHAIANLQISGFQSTASIDRQKLANMDAVDELSAKQQEAAKLQLQDAEEYARTINDPKQAAEYFKQRSDQIIELGKLTDQINETTDKKERERLVERYQLVNAAQVEETKAADLQRKQGSQTQDLIQMLQALQRLQITGPGGKAIGLPGLLDNPIMAMFASILGQLIAPPTAPYQGMGGGQSFVTNRTVNMPVYTNMTPSAAGDSAALILAGMPT